jgi:hypothetical protein
LSTVLLGPDQPMHLTIARLFGHSWAPWEESTLNKTRISITRLSTNGSYRVVVDVHGEAPSVGHDGLVSVLAAIWGLQTARQLKREILDETGSFEADVSLMDERIATLMSILDSSETREVSL